MAKKYWQETRCCYIPSNSFNSFESFPCEPKVMTDSNSNANNSRSSSKNLDTWTSILDWYLVSVDNKERGANKIDDQIDCCTYKKQNGDCVHVILLSEAWRLTFWINFEARFTLVSHLDGVIFVHKSVHSRVPLYSA
jgi:hypothetical protein